jgi:pyrroline-5-carboxylate reductase
MQKVETRGNASTHRTCYDLDSVQAQGSKLMTAIAEKIGFLGAGKMATALARGMLAQQMIVPERLFASDPSSAALQEFCRETGGNSLKSNPDLVRECELLVLAVKPQHVAPVLGEIKDHLSGEKLLISIAAGIRLTAIERNLKPDSRVVRVMPNTPCLIASGACAFSPGTFATADDTRRVAQLLETVGLVEQVPEKLLDVVTGLSGSGPAYVYQIIEALSDGAVRMGLPRTMATKFAAQTVMGAARMVLETGEHPGNLKDAVASPGGTTIAGLHELERGGLRGILMNAVEAASVRSAQLE